MGVWPIRSLLFYNYGAGVLSIDVAGNLQRTLDWVQFALGRRAYSNVRSRPPSLLNLVDECVESLAHFQSNLRTLSDRFAGVKMASRVAAGPSSPPPLEEAAAGRSKSDSHQRPCLAAVLTHISFVTAAVTNETGS